MKDPSAHAARLARLYPRDWRAQFPDFEELLAAELAENHRRIYCNVVGTAIVERLRDIGVIPKRPADRARSGLALIYAALVPFVGLAVGMWSQLHTGVAPLGAATPPVLRASNLLLAVGTLAVLAALPVAIVLLIADTRRVRNDHAIKAAARYGQLARPSIAFVGSLAVLTVAGWGADRSGWYSPAAAALPHRGSGHLATLWVRGIIATITPAWIHPTLIARMPTGELVAALLAPVAALAGAAALFRLIARAPIRTPRLANVVLATTAFGMMVLSVVACGRWLLDHPTREGATTLQVRADQLAPGHTGWVVVLMLAALTIIALVGLRRVLKGNPEDSTPRGHWDAARPLPDPAITGGTVPLRFSTP